MLESPVLEIHLHHRTASTYLVTLRFRDPDNPARQEFLGEAVFDLAVLRQLNLDTQAAEYGQALSRMLFANEDIRRGFGEAIVATQRDRTSLRIQLQITGEDATLHSIRWETLYHPIAERWLLTDENIRFSRFLSSSSWEKVELLPREKLRALVVVANPQDISRYAASIDVQGEIERACRGLDDIPIDTFASDPDHLTRVTLANVITEIRKGPDIVYLACHGLLHGGTPWLLLENEQGNTERVSGELLAEAMSNLLPQDRPLLVVLVSCDSAGTARPGDENALAALGPLLARSGIPAVVAIQGRISMRTAQVFMPVFFRELRRDGKLDRAMAAARSAVRDHTDAWMPVLFTRLDNAELWPTRVRPAGVTPLTIPKGALGRTFISYSHSDRDFAERIARDLHDDGVDVWIDFERLSVGELWREKISQSIRQTDTVIVNLSPRSVMSENVRSEIQIAHDLGKRILPVMSEPCIDLLDDYSETRWLIERHILDFEREGYHYAYSRLLDKLREAVSAAVDPAQIPCPFKGLESFQSTDADYFFGREKLVGEMIDRLRGAGPYRFLAVVGASGSGKSSLVRAGLIHSLREDSIPGSKTWTTTIVTPGPRPIEALATRLRPALAVERPLSALIDELEERPDSLHLLTEEYLGEAPPTARFVLIVDQFEEIFTLAEPEAAAAFIKRLHTAATIEAGRTLVILTMRADFFDRLSAYPDLARLFGGERMVIVTDMEPEDMRRSIEGPAERVGLVYEDGLPERILDEVRGQPGALPLLQFALEKLYEGRDGQRLTHDTYDQIGGVRKALALHAQNLFERLNTPRDDEKRLPYTRGDVMRRIMLQLVEVSDTGEPTRRRVDYRTLAVRDVPGEVVAEVLGTLTAPENRLLVASRAIDPSTNEEAATYVEVSHEALIREWGTFRAWIADNQEQIRYGSDLRRAAEGWINAGRDPAYLLSGSRLVRAEEWLKTADASEQQRELIEASARERDRLAEVEEQRRQHELTLAHKAARNLRRLVASLAAFLIVASGLAAIAYTLYQAAEKSARDLSVSYSQAEAKRVLEPFCSDNGMVPVFLCSELNISAANVRDLIDSLSEKQYSTYVVDEELALALATNDSLLRHSLKIDYDEVDYGPGAAVSGQKILVGSRSGLWILEYQPVFDSYYDEQHWQITRSEQISQEPPVKNVAWLEGERFLTWRRTSGGVDTLTIWASPDADPSPFASFEQPINCAVPQPVLNTWVAVCEGPDLYLYTLGEPGIERFKILHDQDEEATFENVFDRAAWSPDGRWLAAAYHNQMKIWDTQDSAFPVRPIEPAGNDWLVGLQFSAANELLVWTETQVFTIDLTGPDLEAVERLSLESSGDGITAAAWSGGYLAIGIEKSDAPNVRIVKTDDWETITEFRAHANTIVGMVWAGDGHLLTSGLDDFLYIWHIVDQNGILQNQGLLYALPNSIQYEIAGVRWNPALNQALVRYRRSGAWQVWDIDSTGITAHPDPLLGIEDAFWFGSSVIVSVDGALQVRDGETLATVYQQSPSLTAPLKLGTQCGDQFTFVQDDGEVFQWDPPSGQFEELPISLDSTQVKAINCTADGARLFLNFSEADAGKFAVWDVKSRRLAHAVAVPGDAHNAVMSPNGVYIAALIGGELKVWQAEHLEAEPRPILSQSKDSFKGFAWMPTGDRLLTYSDMFIYVWNIDSLIQSPQVSRLAESAPMVLALALPSPVQFAAFNADGSRIMSINKYGNQVNIWRSWSSLDDLAAFAKNYRTNLEIKEAVP